MREFFQEVLPPASPLGRPRLQGRGTGGEFLDVPYCLLPPPSSAARYDPRRGPGRPPLRRHQRLSGLDHGVRELRRGRREDFLSNVQAGLDQALTTSIVLEGNGSFCPGPACSGSEFLGSDPGNDYHRSFHP